MVLRLLQVLHLKGNFALLPLLETLLHPRDLDQRHPVVHLERITPLRLRGWQIWEE